MTWNLPVDGCLSGRHGWRGRLRRTARHPGQAPGLVALGRECRRWRQRPALGIGADEPVVGVDPVELAVGVGEVADARLACRRGRCDRRVACSAPGPRRSRARGRRRPAPARAPRRSAAGSSGLRCAGASRAARAIRRSSSTAWALISVASRTTSGSSWRARRRSLRVTGRCWAAMSSAVWAALARRRWSRPAARGSTAAVMGAGVATVRSTRWYRLKRCLTRRITMQAATIAAPVHPRSRRRAQFTSPGYPADPAAGRRRARRRDHVTSGDGPTRRVGQALIDTATGAGSNDGSGGNGEASPPSQWTTRTRPASRSSQDATHDSSSARALGSGSRRRAPGEVQLLDHRLRSVGIEVEREGHGGVAGGGDRPRAHQATVAQLGARSARDLDEQPARRPQRVEATLPADRRRQRRGPVAHVRRLLEALPRRRAPPSGRAAARAAGRAPG